MIATNRKEGTIDSHADMRLRLATLAWRRETCHAAGLREDPAATRSLRRFFGGLLLGLSLAGASEAEEFAATQAEIDAWIGADTNADGALTGDEFPRFVDAMAASGQSTAQTVRFFGAYEIAFAIIDRDGDGRLMPEELRSADDSYRETEER